MSDVREYKCPSCGAPMQFDIEAQCMVCSFCAGRYDLDYIRSHFNEVTDEKLSDFDWVERTKYVWEPDVLEQLAEYTCSSCGGNIITKNIISSARCPFCGHDVVISSNFDGDLRPDRVIPFSRSAEEFAEKYREKIESETNINTLRMKEIQNTQENEMQDLPRYRDGQMVRIVGIINGVKKKYTKTNKIMAFTTIEDLYGQCEVIVFENCYQMCANILMDESIVLVEGRLSIREDEDVKIVANKIIEFKGENTQPKGNVLKINITNLNDEQKEKLRGIIKFFAGDRNNCRIDIQNGDRVDSAGGVLMSGEILKEFQEIVGEENIKQGV